MVKISFLLITCIDYLLRTGHACYILVDGKKMVDNDAFRYFQPEENGKNIESIDIQRRDVHGI